MNCESRILAEKHLLVAALGLLVLFSSALSQAQITPLGDSYTFGAHPATNYGSAALLYVNGATETTYIQFNLASIPPGETVSQATLKLYVNAVTTAGSFNVDYVNGSWSESTITYEVAPALGSTIVSDVPITAADTNQYILINVTSAVQAWLSGSETNDGLALVANSTFNASFDSKENTVTSHPPELDIAYGDGTITGITTAGGSGLSGGGTSGNLNLSLTNSCASGQVLQWNGTAWVCTALNTGGTITAVVAGADLTGGGTSGSVTLNLDTTRVPLLAASNTFTGNQTVNGNLSATGVVTGSSYQIASYLFAYGSYGHENAFLGFAGNTTMTSSFNTASGAFALSSNTTGTSNTASGVDALNSNTTGSYNTASGVLALYFNNGTDNTATGYQALEGNTTGSENTASGAQALLSNTTGGNNTATGYLSLYSNTTAYNNTAIGSYALYLNTTGYNDTATGNGALSSNTTGAENTGTGQSALGGNTTGTSNTGTGLLALTSNTTGSQNTATGTFALDVNITGSYLTCMGYGCQVGYVGLDGLSNATAIGALAEVDENNALILGSISGVNGATSNTKVGIGTTTPGNIFTIGQGFGQAIADGWATYSSRRWKTNIKTLHNALGKVEQLRGVSYDLKDSGKHEIGVIAEEVGNVIPEVVSWDKNGQDAQGVDYSRLTALLIEAIKEQQIQIHQQQQQLRVQRTRVDLLTQQLRQVQAVLKDSNQSTASVHRAKSASTAVENASGVGTSTQTSPVVRRVILAEH